MTRTRAGRLPRRSRQRGAAFYLFAVMVVAAVATLVSAAPAFDVRRTREEQAGRLLAEARARVLAYLTTPQIALNAVDTGRRLGDWRLYPDLPIAAGAGIDAGEPAYDGFAETGGCAWRTWSAGQALQPVATSGAAARCFGRLPWRELGLNLGDTAPDSDGDGRLPWIVVSPNLATGSACLPDLTPLLLTRAYAGFGCSGTPPHPWITVLDERGNLLSSRVAIALILPGPVVGGQLRGPAAAPAQFLDRVTILPGCPAPCQPGTYDNAGYGHADGTPTVLIRAPRDARAAERAGFYAMPYAFNDRIAYLTIDELIGELERHARRELTTRLRQFLASRNHFPYAAAFNSSTGDCASGVRYGHPAVNDGNCGAGNAAALAQWFVDGGWHRYFLYSVSPRCVAANPVCSGSGLTVGATTTVNALLISPGAPVVTPPFAPSKLGPQVPLIGLLTSALATAADYVDDPVNAGLVADTFASTAGQAFPRNDRLEIVN